VGQREKRSPGCGVNADQSINKSKQQKLFGCCSQQIFLKKSDLGCKIFPNAPVGGNVNQPRELLIQIRR
jgi:hypothetical protein